MMVPAVILSAIVLFSMAYFITFVYGTYITVENYYEDDVQLEYDLTFYKPQIDF